MMANDRSLRRGAVMALLAALLQATVAIVLVGAAALILNATASQMNAAADWLALASDARRRGRSACGCRGARAGRSSPRCAAISNMAGRWRPRRPYAGRRPGRAGVRLAAAAFRAATPGADAGGGLSAATRTRADPTLLGEPFFLARRAGTVIAAGARPCSGAILVLVFALAQGVFAAGVAATFAMSLGVAGDDGALACDGGVRQVDRRALRRGRGFARRARRPRLRIRRLARGAGLRPRADWSATRGGA